MSIVKVKRSLSAGDVVATIWLLLSAGLCVALWSGWELYAPTAVRMVLSGALAVGGILPIAARLCAERPRARVLCYVSGAGMVFAVCMGYGVPLWLSHRAATNELATLRAISPAGYEAMRSWLAEPARTAGYFPSISAGIRESEEQWLRDTAARVQATFGKSPVRVLDEISNYADVVQALRDRRRHDATRFAEPTGLESAWLAFEIRRLADIVERDPHAAQVELRAAGEQLAASRASERLRQEFLEQQKVLDRFAAVSVEWLELMRRLDALAEAERFAEAAALVTSFRSKLPIDPWCSKLTDRSEQVAEKFSYLADLAALAVGERADGP